MISNINILDEKHNILSLLPYSENAQLVNKQQKLDDLYFIKAVVDFSIIALKQFMAGNLVFFDAQVGENLCQIRACKILYLAKKWLYIPSSKEEFSKEIKLFKDYKSKLEFIIFEWENAIKHSTAFNKNLDGTENISDFFTRHDLLLDLSDDFIFIITCCFLTHFNIRDNNIPVAINLEYISREFHISKYRSKRLTHKYQQLICKLGCNFIMNIANQLPSQHRFMEILPALYQVADEDRTVLPCYTVSEIILYHNQKEKIPILFIVHQLTNSEFQHKQQIIYFLFTCDNEQKDWLLTPCSSYLSDHCMIVTGEVIHQPNKTHETTKQYVTRILEEGPLKLILANTAIHPQYSGKKLSSWRENPFPILMQECSSTIKNQHENNLLTMQQFAVDYGCSKQNRSLFFLRHIYANSLEEEINNLEEHHKGLILDANQIFNHVNHNG